VLSSPLTLRCINDRLFLRCFGALNTSVGDVVYTPHTNRGWGEGSELGIRLDRVCVAWLVVAVKFLHNPYLVSGINSLYIFVNLFWYQFLNFRLTYSFSHHFFLVWFTILLIHNSLSLLLPASKLLSEILPRSFTSSFWIAFMGLPVNSSHDQLVTCDELTF